MNDLTALFTEKDFPEVWRRIATDIKVRKYEKLSDIPEFNQMSSELQDKIKSCASGTGFNYQTFKDGVLYITVYTVLISQGEGNWMGMFEYNYVSTTGKVLGVILGAVVLLGGIYYFDGAPPTRLASIKGWISKKCGALPDALIERAGTFLTRAVFNEFVRWLMNDHSKSDSLIAACILKKLQAVRDS